MLKCCQITAIFLIYFGLKENSESPDFIDKHNELYSGTFIIGTNVLIFLSIFVLIIEILKLNYTNVLKKNYKPIVSN